ncbi:MAG: MGMT family protein [bacterium]|nr:MGMT family protein [bacterium]
MSEFKDKVLSIIFSIPEGTVVSYGQVAAMSGVARGARQVGWILNKSEGTAGLPWWRVINNSGRITIKGCEFNTPLLQKQMLEHESVIVSDDYTIDMNKFRYRPGVSILQSFGLDDEYIERLSLKYDL